MAGIHTRQGGGIGKMAALTPDEMRTLLRNHFGWKLPRDKYDDVAVRRIYHRHQDQLTQRPAVKRPHVEPLYVYRDKNGYLQLVYDYVRE